MTLEAYSSLPFAAGGAVANAAGRGALWVAGLYMREPARNTAVAALVALSVLAGANALYKQSHHHPAPLFGSFSATPSPASRTSKPERPVVPVARPTSLDIDTSETTGSLAAAPATPAAAIGNEDVLALQKKLAALSLFTGTADGLFGPRTARAIKAFEQSVGRTPRGLLTQQIVDLVSSAPLPVAGAVLPTSPSASAMPAAVTSSAKAPMPLSLPAPSPLTASVSTSSTPTVTASAVAPSTLDAPNEQDAPQIAAVNDTAIQSGVQTLPMNDPTAVPKRVVQTIAVRAETGQPMPSALAPTPADDETASTDPDTVAAVQRGLNSLGFLHGNVDGVAGEATAKAIRNFEVFYNYEVTGRISRGLLDLLKANGATI